MAIPTNLLPINNPDRINIDAVLPSTIAQIPKLGVPSTLLPINTSQISASFQSVLGKIPTIDIPQIPQFPVLNVVLPDRLFTTGSIDQIKARALRAAEIYINGLPLALPTLTIPTITIPFPPPRPSFGQIKNFIKTKIDRIKRERQQASVKVLREQLKKQENPFEYRRLLRNKQLQNTVLGIRNNRQR